jgi:hypothetical protein
MTEASNNLPISIDYTSRDFYALREDLITRIKANIPEWLGTDPTDFGIALVEAFAYMGDVANYYIDRVANESFVSTATQRVSLLGYANSIGYTVDGYRSSTTTLSFGNSSSSGLTLPAGTIVYADILVNNQIRRIKFTLDNAVIVPGNTPLTGSTYTTTATQGYAVANAATSGAVNTETGIYSVKIATTTGQANQTYTLNDNNVVDGSLNVYIKDGLSYVKWTKVSDLTLYGKRDRVYTTTLDENNYITLVFGDGVSGFIPTSSNEIWASYNLGDGIYGNMSAATVSSSISPILYVPGYSDPSAFTPYITLTNTEAATGGADPESNASIRAGAASVVGTIGKAVTLADYEILALTAVNSGKAKAYSVNYSTVTLFVAPKRDSVTPFGYSFGYSDIYPGYTPTKSAITSEMNTLLTDVASVVNQYTQIGVTVTTTPVYYTNVNIAYNYTAVPGYSNEDIESAVDTHITSRFSYINSKISDVLTPDNIAKEIISIPGIATASVTLLSKTSSGLSTLTGNPGEIFVITAGNITGTNTGQTTLSSLTATWNGVTTSPTPSFNSGIRSYTYSVTGSYSFILTPSLTSGDVSAGALITVGGTVVNSGSTATIPLNEGVNTISVVVTNADFVKTTYTLTIIRS